MPRQRLFAYVVASDCTAVRFKTKCKAILPRLSLINATRRSQVDATEFHKNYCRFASSFAFSSALATFWRFQSRHTFLAVGPGGEHNCSGRRYMPCDEESDSLVTRCAGQLRCIERRKGGRAAPPTAAVGIGHDFARKGRIGGKLYQPAAQSQAQSLGRTQARVTALLLPKQVAAIYCHAADYFKPVLKTLPLFGKRSDLHPVSWSVRNARFFSILHF